MQLTNSADIRRRMWCHSCEMPVAEMHWHLTCQWRDTTGDRAVTPVRPFHGPGVAPIREAGKGVPAVRPPAVKGAEAPRGPEARVVSGRSALASPERVGGAREEQQKVDFGRHSSGRAQTAGLTWLERTVYVARLASAQGTSTSACSSHDCAETQSSARPFHGGGANTRGRRRRP